MLLSHRHPLLYKLAVLYHRQKRTLAWLIDQRPYASEFRKGERLPFKVKRHASRLIKQLGDTPVQLQLNKVHNLKLCLPHIDGLIIHPGETFSFCRRVGRPTTKRGFRPGMELSMGEARVGIGGGICQLANMLSWLVLHSPLTITERSTHSFDPFPDNNRSIPFGTGCAIFYNYVDFCFSNRTDYTFHIHLNIDDSNLNGYLTSNRRVVENYKIYEKNHHFVKENAVIYRHNEIWRKVLVRIGGQHLRDEHLRTNHVRVMYTPDGPVRTSAGENITKAQLF